jgi:hypothetical protein
VVGEEDLPPCLLPRPLFRLLPLLSAPLPIHLVSARRRGRAGRAGKVSARGCQRAMGAREACLIQIPWSASRSSDSPPNPRTAVSEVADNYGWDPRPSPPSHAAAAATVFLEKRSEQGVRLHARVPPRVTARLFPRPLAAAGGGEASEAEAEARAWKEAWRRRACLAARWLRESPFFMTKRWPAWWRMGIRSRRSRAGVLLLLLRAAKVKETYRRSSRRCRQEMDHAAPLSNTDRAIQSNTDRRPAACLLSWGRIRLVRAGRGCMRR